MRLHYRYEKGVCAKEREDVSIVKRREERSVWVHKRTIEEGLYQTLKVVSNGTSVFCRKKRWKKEDGTRLSISQ